MHTKADPGLKFSRGMGGGGGAVFPGDGVPRGVPTATAHSYYDFPEGGGGSGHPLWLHSCIPKDGVGLSSRSLNKAST